MNNSAVHSEEVTVGLAAQWTIAEKDGAELSAVMTKQPVGCQD